MTARSTANEERPGLLPGFSCERATCVARTLGVDRWNTGSDDVLGHPAPANREAARAIGLANPMLANHEESQ